MIWKASKQASKQASRQAGKQASRQAGKQASRQAGKQASRQAGKQASRQAGKQASRQAGKQASKQASKASKQASRKTAVSCLSSNVTNLSFIFLSQRVHLGLQEGLKGLWAVHLHKAQHHLFKCWHSSCHPAQQTCRLNMLAIAKTSFCFSTVDGVSFTLQAILAISLWQRYWHCPRHVAFTRPYATHDSGLCTWLWQALTDRHHLHGCTTAQECLLLMLLCSHSSYKKAIVQACVLEFVGCDIVWIDG